MLVEPAGKGRREGCGGGRSSESRSRIERRQGWPAVRQRSHASSFARRPRACPCLHAPLPVRVERRAAGACRRSTSIYPSQSHRFFPFLSLFPSATLNRIPSTHPCLPAASLLLVLSPSPCPRRRQTPSTVTQHQPGRPPCFLPSRPTLPPTGLFPPVPRKTTASRPPGEATPATRRRTPWTRRAQGLPTGSPVFSAVVRRPSSNNRSRAKKLSGRRWRIGIAAGGRLRDC